MGRALRAEQFAVDQVSIVHVIQRCVRRAFLAGVDQKTGKDFGYRREWIRRRMEALASVFGIDVIGYAILSNHMHLILRNRPDVVASWSDREVAIRWLRVFPGRRLEEYLGEPTESDVERLVRDKQRLTELRSRLSNISWFMRALSEPIARMANKQDECTGRFWEGRFKAQPLVDEAGLLACAMYVDLNPVRAALAENPEQSIHTSAYDRIRGNKGEEILSAACELIPVSTAEAGSQLRDTPVDKLQSKQRKEKRNPTGKKIRRDAWLSPLRLHSGSEDPQVHKGGIRASNKGFLGMDLSEYLRLLHWTAKRPGEEGDCKAPGSLPTLLERLGIELTMWRDLVWNFQRYFGRSGCVGSPGEMRSFAISKGRRWSKGDRAVAPCFA
jgi:REP element-mobilizing transposase RayT